MYNSSKFRNTFSRWFSTLEKIIMRPIDCATSLPICIVIMNKTSTSSWIIWLSDKDFVFTCYQHRSNRYYCSKLEYLVFGSVYLVSGFAYLELRNGGFGILNCDCDIPAIGENVWQLEGEQLGTKSSNMGDVKELEVFKAEIIMMFDIDE